jgi:polyisoprenoid-binding protein YceI
MRWLAAFALVLAVSTGVSAQDLSKDPARAPNGTYRLAATHTQVLFAISHLGLNEYYGRFDKVSGTLSFDANQPERSAVSITIGMDGIDTPSRSLNDDLQSSDVFDADKFPTATFKSVSVTRTGPDRGTIAGVLTIKGISKPVTLDATFSGGEQDPLNGDYALGFHATTIVKRSDFGLTGMVWEPLVGGDVKLIIEAMFEQEKE